MMSQSRLKYPLAHTPQSNAYENFNKHPGAIDIA